MKFCLISDLHIDHHPLDYSCFNNLSKDCNTLVVAGDISNDVFDTSRELIKLKSYFKEVIWVAGNHCFYNLGFHKTRLYNREWDTKWPYPHNVSEIYDHYARWSQAHDVHFLHRADVIMDGVQFVGVTGWHNFDAAPYLRFEDQVQAWQDGMNDSRYINWGPDTFGDFKPVLTAALDDADYLRDIVGLNDVPKVILSHHIPHRDLVKVTGNPGWNLLNGSFLNTELETVRHSSVKVWCYGHTHFREDRVIDGIRHVNNARGYPRENSSWSPVEIEIHA
jgi:predicted phosphodiesterase